MLSSTMATQVTQLLDAVSQLTLQAWIVIVATGLFTVALCIYTTIFAVAPVPRAPRPSEHTYQTTDGDGNITKPLRLPCWHDRYLAKKELSQRSEPAKDKKDVEAPEVFMSLVIPAYNEEARIGKMLEEAVAFLDYEYGGHSNFPPASPSSPNIGAKRKKPTPSPRSAAFSSPPSTPTTSNGFVHHPRSGEPKGWEILVVSDGCTDSTAAVVFSFARRFSPGTVRLITLERNRGKGGAVTHGLRHVRGAYALFADADGATRFSDLGALVASAARIADPHGRAVAIGSRAHLVGSDAVVKRSALRNFLMHSFHSLLWLLTPPATSRIRDTQCGFKLMSRAALPYIVPHMHSEGWIFDVEMLMLAESAGVPMGEVPVMWEEVLGSKLNVLWDSLGMAWGLAVLRAAWKVGVYRV